ncbi:hypothetical protein QYY77_20140 [Xanthomonas campestris pv. campestris]|uniref:hypothetical protein n=1 Tax=Xanthomonas campestris TaxID=339 RepID=UPI000E1F8376|nr:hypothetical protein [Xanthomonas campestris]MEA0738345.1 hypothetical protein [Xanthomonas campestris pv. campestris]
MKSGSSITWRQEGDEQAFDDAAWEFRSCQFESSAGHCLRSFDATIADPTFETIMWLPTAEFLLSLALELLCKAYYLKAKIGRPEDIYSHNVVDLVGSEFFSEDQAQLMRHAERYVIWAGRYPTPKWTKEYFKEGYDVASRIVGNVEHIDGADIPNTASRPRCTELLELCQHVRSRWAQA